jgi:hypothetical protein
MSVAANRRTQTRHDVSLAAKLTLNGDSRPATVMNLSLGGALVNAGMKFAMGSRVHISFAIPTLEEPIEIGATVRWSDDKSTGLQFDGLRARDVWGLNKFFEQLPVSS